MEHCTQCGERLHSVVPDGDDRERRVCAGCGMIHYTNPVVVVGCLASWQGRVLLCRRAIEPRSGLWTLPAGFLELDETTEQGALRECREETGARLQLDDFYCLLDLPAIGEVHVLYRGTLLGPELHAGAECLDVGLFTRDEVPWENLAHAPIGETLERYFADQASGCFPVRVGGARVGARARSASHRSRLLGHG